MTQAYPLQWPQNKSRTKYPAPSRFGKNISFEKIRVYLCGELKLLGAKNIVISTNIPLRNDGFPYANYKKPSDCGVAVYFLYELKPMCFACDRWDRIEDNLKAIAETIKALRGIRRWGSGDMLKSAFEGFVSLPSPKKWWEILGVRPENSLELIRETYKILCMKHHPDRGGDHSRMAEINAAWDQAQKEKGKT